MDRQDIYNKVRAHLLAMTGPAIRANELPGAPPMCLYLAPDGKKCAVGILIPDGHEAQGYLGDVMDLLKEHPDLGNLWGIDEWDQEWEPSEYDDVTFLYQLQKVHDGTDDGGVMEHWGDDGLNDEGRLALLAVADEWGLAS